MFSCQLVSLCIMQHHPHFSGVNRGQQLVLLLVWVVPTCAASPVTPCWVFRAQSGVPGRLAGQPPLSENGGTGLASSVGMHDGGFQSTGPWSTSSKDCPTKSQHLPRAKRHLPLTSRARPHTCSQTPCEMLEVQRQIRLDFGGLPAWELRLCWSLGALCWVGGPHPEDMGRLLERSSDMSPDWGPNGSQALALDVAVCMYWWCCFPAL